jgi:hypothetical protein
VIEKTIDTAREFLSKLAGPATEEIGFLLQDKARFYRLKNQLGVLAQAKQLLAEAGLEPKAIPLRTLLPLLEGAALEDDGFLSAKWAALIANASICNQPSDNHPSFPKILSEISPQDALLIDHLAERGGEFDWNNFRNEMSKELSISHDQVNHSHNNLFRLMLWLTKRNIITITPFGKLFLKACTAPKKMRT